MSDPTAAAPAAAPAAAAAAAPAAAPVAAPAAPAIPWLADATPEMVGHIQNKAWSGPADAVKSHYELEKLLGADRAGRTVVIPKEGEPWDGVWSKLGRPASAADYALPVPEGQDGTFAKTAAEVFHKAGLTAAQGRELAAWWNEAAGNAAKDAEAQQQAALAAEHAALEKDWGTGPDAQMRRELARRAAVNLGLDKSSIDALEKAVGYSKTMKALAKVGDLLRESNAEGLQELGSFGMTPEGARTRRAQLMADADWRKRAMAPNSKEWAELQSLDRILAPSA